MKGHIGFSYIGLIFLLLLFIPNLIWTKKQPAGYTSANENKVLLLLERIGEVCVSTCALIFCDFNWQGWSARAWFLIAAFILLGLYELWWLRYFRSEQGQEDFYSGLFGIPLAGATLPVAAFFLLGLYGRVIWMLASVVILGIGHIGIHWQHWRELTHPLQ